MYTESTHELFCQRKKKKSGKKSSKQRNSKNANECSTKCFIHWLIQASSAAFNRTKFVVLLELLLVLGTHALTIDVCSVCSLVFFFFHFCYSLFQIHSVYFFVYSVYNENDSNDRTKSAVQFHFFFFSFVFVSSTQYSLFTFTIHSKFSVFIIQSQIQIQYLLGTRYCVLSSTFLVYHSLAYKELHMDCMFMAAVTFKTADSFQFLYCVVVSLSSGVHRITIHAQCTHIRGLRWKMKRKKKQKNKKSNMNPLFIAITTITLLLKYYFITYATHTHYRTIFATAVLCVSRINRNVSFNQNIRNKQRAPGSRVIRIQCEIICVFVCVMFLYSVLVEVGMSVIEIVCLYTKKKVFKIEIICILCCWFNVPCV